MSAPRILSSFNRLSSESFTMVSCLVAPETTTLRHWGSPRAGTAMSHFSIMTNPPTRVALVLDWTRAATLIRINSLISVCSAVRPMNTARIQDHSRHNIMPMIPLGGSNSSPGDPSRLSSALPLRGKQQLGSCPGATRGTCMQTQHSPTRA